MGRPERSEMRLILRLFPLPGTTGQATARDPHHRTVAAARWPRHALRAAVVGACGLAAADCSPSRSSSAATTRARRTAPSASSTSSTSRCATRPRCCAASRATRRFGPTPRHRLPSPSHRPRRTRRASAGRGLRPLRPVRRAAARADGLQTHRARARPRSAPPHPGHLGPVAQAKVLTPESNVQFGEGGAGLFSDGKLYSQIKDPKFLRPQGDARVRARRCARGDPLRQQAAHRHVPPHRRGGAMREQIIALGGEVRFESRSPIC
jgi:hypothetical protein